MEKCKIISKCPEAVSLYLRDPAVGGEDLVLLVNVDNLVEGDAELDCQGRAGVLHRPHGLKQGQKQDRYSPPRGDVFQFDLEVFCKKKKKELLLKKITFNLIDGI